MKFRTILGFAVVGAFLYIHIRRGGELTIESIAQTARELFGRAKREAGEIKDRTEKAAIHDVAKTVAEVTDEQHGKHA